MINASEINFTVDELDQIPCGAPCVGIGRTIWGHFDAVSFLNKAGPGPLREFFFENDILTVHTQEQVNFVVRIPCSLLTKSDSKTKMLVQYGHGLFGDRKELLDGYLGDMAEKYQWIMFATDWAGMSKFDLLSAFRVFAFHAEEFYTIPNRLTQGFLFNAITLRMMRLQFSSDPSMLSCNGTKLILPEKTPFAYYGNSMGSIVGGGYLAYSVDHTIGVLGVPGSPFALILSRSKDFTFFDKILKLQLWRQQDVRLYISLFQMLWDPSERFAFRCTGLDLLYTYTSYICLFVYMYI